ncbi:MAG TPA: Clp protease N-terminal domain-containing protein [Pirellulales bacterium]|nr:Clp protease N-terminal domain-containing protein [Pirellulales bacterium]
MAKVDLQRFSADVRKAMQRANAMAEADGHDYISTRHILLALTMEDDGQAHDLLHRLGITADIIPLPAPLGKPSKTPIVEQSFAEAERLGHHVVGTLHLLLGLLADGEAMDPILESRSLSRPRMRSEIVEELKRLPPESPQAEDALN